MSGICKTKGKEKGAWFEVNSIANIIIAKEAKGQDAEFERSLLIAWAKHPDYKMAKEALSQIDRREISKKQGVLIIR